MALRVAFNATPLLSPLTGIGNYIVHLAAALEASGTIDAYAFYGHRWARGWPQPPIAAAKARAWRGAVVRGLKPWVPFRRELRAAQQRIVFARGLRRFAIELYHEPNYVPLAFDVPVVLTVHDLSWVHFPQTHPGDRVRWLERHLPPALDRAAAVLVDSDFVRREVLAAFPVPPERVHAVHLGVDARFRPRTALATRVVLGGHGLRHGEYVLSVGTVEPRKNLRHVLAAYARLPQGIRTRYPLVVAGARGWQAHDLERDLARLTDAGEVRFLGHVPSEDLPLLYAGAALFVFPSLYEGFGLPPLEAMASGVPVLVSDRASLPEVVGDAGVRLDPDDPEATTRHLAALLDDPAARTRLGERGRARAARFTWQACADRTRHAYALALGGPLQ